MSGKSCWKEECRSKTHVLIYGERCEADAGLVDVCSRSIGQPLIITTLVFGWRFIPLNLTMPSVEPK
jgi:hypothetical protein